MAMSILGLASKVFASTSGAGLPWEGPLQTIASSLQGPVATSISIIALVGAAISLMFFEVGKGMRQFIVVILAFSIVSSAYSLMGLFGLTSALF